MNKGLMKSSYELAKTLEDIRHKTYSETERLERLEHLEVVLRMWVNNITSEQELAYKQAQQEVFQILNESKKGLLPKYEDLINEFTIPEEY